MGEKRVKAAYSAEKRMNYSEIKEVWKILKKRKALSIYHTPNEVWMHGGRSITNKLIEIIKRIWEVGDMLEEWKAGIILPFYKIGDSNDLKN